MPDRTQLRIEYSHLRSRPASSHKKEKSLLQAKLFLYEVWQRKNQSVKNLGWDIVEGCVLQRFFFNVFVDFVYASLRELDLLFLFEAWNQIIWNIVYFMKTCIARSTKNNRINIDFPAQLQNLPSRNAWSPWLVTYKQTATFTFYWLAITWGTSLNKFQMMIIMFFGTHAITKAYLLFRFLFACQHCLAKLPEKVSVL